jgi:hypothetical protein
VHSTTAPLRPLLYDLIYRAQKLPDIPQSITLETGLKVEVLYFNEEIRLLLSRADNYPSQGEFWEILENWPFDQPKPPREQTVEGRFYLITTWPSLSLPPF